MIPYVIEGKAVAVMDWTSGFFEASPIGVGIAVGTIIVASLVYLMWSAFKGRRS